MKNILWFKHAKLDWSYVISVNIESEEVFIVYYDRSKESEKLHNYKIADVLSAVCDGSWVQISGDEFDVFNVGQKVEIISSGSIFMICENQCAELFLVDINVMVGFVVSGLKREGNLITKRNIEMLLGGKVREV